MSRPAQAIMQRLNALAKISDAPGQITRLFASDAMRRANALVGTWMRAAGMRTHLDAIGNLVGDYAGTAPGAKILLLGSHLDTVRNAGKFDGPLGVLLAIACVPFGSLWRDWLTAVTNMRTNGPPGFAFSLLQLPFLLLPFVAWLGRRSPPKRDPVATGELASPSGTR